MKLVITCREGTVAVIDDWDGPVPRAGEYIHRPRGTEPVPGMLDGFMQVKSVGWGIIGREHGAPHFAGAAVPFVELTV